MEKYIIIAFSIFCSGLSCSAQDFKTLVEDLRNAYEKSKALHLVMEVAVYENAAATSAYHRQTIDIRRHDDNYWYQLEDSEMLLNEKYLVAVDMKMRQISYSKRSLGAEREMQKAFRFNPDSILAQYDAPAYLGVVEGAEHYLVKEKKGLIEEVHFYIVKSNLTLKKIAYKYREGQYVSIRFVVFDRQPKFDGDAFSEDKYLVKVNDRMVPSRFYKKFQLSCQ